MITKRGSQNREPLAESGYTLLSKKGNEVILEEGGIPELWTKRDDYSGYVIEIDGVGYEFVRSALQGDLDEHNLKL